MNVNTSSNGITTMLVMAFALFVLYSRTRNWLDSNVPLIFYGALILYTNAVEDEIPMSLIYVGLALAAILRFEFMNNALTRVLKFFDYCVLGAIVYFCAGEFIQL